MTEKQSQPGVLPENVKKNILMGDADEFTQIDPDHLLEIIGSNPNASLGDIMDHLKLATTKKPQKMVAE